MKTLGLGLALLVGMGLLALYGRGWWGTTLVAAPPPPAQVMWLCLETGELSEGPRPESGGEAPRLNPATGRASLVQALYCPRCRGWRRMPPQAVRERMPGGPVCPRTRTPLLETAPAGAPRELAR